MNDYLIDHTNTITGRGPKRGEYAILAVQVVRKLKEMNVENADTYKVTLIIINIIL